MNPLKRARVAWRIAPNAEALDALDRELRRLREVNKDLNGQVKELLKAHPMTEEQLADIALVRKDNDQMRYEMNALTIYMRTRWPEDFQTGRHGDRGLSEIVIRYLARIKDPHAAEV